MNSPLNIAHIQDTVDYQVAKTSNIEGNLGLDVDFHLDLPDPIPWLGSSSHPSIESPTPMRAIDLKDYLLTSRPAVAALTQKQWNPNMKSAPARHPARASLPTKPKWEPQPRPTRISAISHTTAKPD
ncbi:hypothetical protein ACWA7J_12990 [Leptothrix sp. BB-4]